MSAGQRSGTGAMTELNDEEVRKDEILTNREKAQRTPGQSLDGKAIQTDEYKDNPANKRPAREGRSGHEEPGEASDTGETSKTAANVDRPGFDLGGSTGENSAGKGLGLGGDAKDTKKGWKLPR